MRSESRRESEVLVLNTVSSDPSCDRVTEMEVDVDSEGDTTSYCLKCGHPEEVLTTRDQSTGQLQLQLQQSSSIVNSHPNNNNNHHRINSSSINNNNNLKNRTLNSLRSLSSSSKKSVMSLFVIVIIINVLVLLFPSTAFAVDLHPHGGFYHREGGNDFFASSQQHHQSSSSPDFGGGRGGEYDMSDMIMTCSRPIKSSRAAKYLAIKQLDIPCDMADKKSAWCNLPGNKYPWHAVRRFVFENQGLMRRMYGEVRQLSLLRMEFEDDLDDEIEEERQGPPRSPPLPEDHRRNSILTEILDESLPRILSDTPPGDQLLLRDHHNKNVQERSTPRTLSSSTTTTFFPPPEMMAASTMTSAATATSTSGTLVSDDATSTSTSAATTTPVIVSSSEEQMNATEMMMGFTTGMDSIMSDGMNSTTSFTTITGETETASPPPLPPSTIVARKDLLEELVTEESIQSTGAAATAADITETDKDMNTDGTDDDGETTVTTTEQMITLMSEQEFSEGPSDFSSIQAQESAGSSVMDQQQEQVQQLNDGLFENIGLQASDGAESSLGVPGPSSDESHDFLNLDKNHILYFEDVGKTRRPVGSGSGAGGGAGSSGSGDQYNPQPQPEQQPQQQQTGKIKAVNACPVKEEVVAPYWANNTRGEILALLNLYPFEQYIHWERCNHENKQMFCRQGCRCEQQYRLHRLLAFDPTNECRGIFSDWFRFPSCCVCRCYLNEYELMMLNAAGQEPNGASAAAKSRTSDRIRSPRKMLLEQLVDGPDVQGVDDMHFFYKQGFYHEHNHGAQPRRKKRSFS